MTSTVDLVKVLDGNGNSPWGSGSRTLRLAWGAEVVFGGPSWAHFRPNGPDFLIIWNSSCIRVVIQIFILPAQLYTKTKLDHNTYCIFCNPYNGRENHNGHSNENGSFCSHRQATVELGYNVLNGSVKLSTSYLKYVISSIASESCIAALRYNRFYILSQ